MSNVFEKRESFKPFQYPWAYDIWLKHERVGWISREVQLHEDVKDWNNKLNEEDREFLTNVFLLFTQSDVDVAGGYVKDYLPHFSNPEIRMMLLSFAAREAIHYEAYSYLIESLGKPDSFYSEFLKIPAMKEKHDFFEKLLAQYKGQETLPLQIAGISAFTEGMMLFSSFVMLLKYPRRGLMKGMGQIVSWSILDEQIHVAGLIELFKTIIKENPHLWNDSTKSAIYNIAHIMADLEFDFIDYVGEDDDLKEYIRFIVDLRLKAMGLKPIFGVDKNPLPWVDEIINSQTHGNFFETREVSYAKGALEGSWSNVWGKYGKKME